MASIHKGAGAIEHPVITPLAAPGTSILAERPAPAAPRIGELAGTAIAHKRTSLNRRAMLPATGPLGASTEHPPPQVVVGVSNQGIALVAGSLRVWHAQANAWHPTASTGIASVKLGANNDQVWALGENGALGQIDPDGVARAAQFQLPAGTREFAVSPTAAMVSYISADGAILQHGKDAPTQALALPDAMRGAPASLAQTNSGHLFIASDTGEVWRKAPGGHAAEARWTRLDLPTGPSPSAKLSQLQVMREGSLGAQDAEGRLYRFDPHAQAWSTTTMHAETAYRRAFERPTAASKWQHTRLNGAPLQHARLSLPAAPAATAGHDDVALVKATLRRAMGQLSRKGLRTTLDLTRLAPQDRARIVALLDGTGGPADHATAHAGIDHITHQALAALEEQIGSLPRSKEAGKVHDPDHNALAALWHFRSDILMRKRTGTTPDPVTARITALLSKGICLPVNEPASMIALGRILVAHAQVKQEIDAMQRAAQGADGQAPEAGKEVSKEDAAKVATLFKAGIVDSTQFERMNALSTLLTAGMGDMKSALVKAAHPVEASSAEELGERFAELVGNLQPGKESIKLSFSNSHGFDLEGLWMFFNINSDTFGAAGKHVLSANKLPILTPLATGSHGGTMSLEIGRTDTGVHLALSHETTTSASLGVRIQWRLGGVWEKAGGAATLLAVAGGEAAAIPGGAISNSRSVAMFFEQDDAGKAQRVIKDLYCGKASLIDLLERADEVVNTRGESFNLNTEAYAHAFVALRANYGKPNEHLKPGTQLAASNLLVPALDQVSGKVNYDSSTLVSSDTRGNISHNTKKGMTGSVDFNHITVVDVSTWFSIPYGKAGSTQIQWKAPALLSVLSRNLWKSKLDAPDASLRLAPDGSLAGAAITIGTMDAATRSKHADRPLTPELFPQLAALSAAQPGVQRYIDVINASPELCPAITLELTPIALGQLHARIAGLAQAGQAPDQARQALVDEINTSLADPANLRIARIDIASVQAKPTLSIGAFGPLRAVNGLSHTLQEAGSSIAVHYADGSENATGFKVDGKAILGNAVRPNIASVQ